MKKVKNTMIYLGSCMLLMLFKINSVYAIDVTMPGKSDLGCDGVFGDPADPNSIASLIKEILDIFRIVAPILVIVLGSIDLFMAMASASEDKMKKAQTNFMKRIIMGVCLFFVPAIINFVLDAASKAMGYPACMFNW